jgi:2-C-methyl-D-erythritol 2,4-cyclodiphosphate synthase
MSPKFRVGLGHDVHALAPSRRLVLGGVEIHHTHGLMGWSDADVVIHAVMDALLGAAALGDIGTHFPPGDPRFKDASSLLMLTEVSKMLHEKGWQVGNIDVMVLAEAPRLKDYLPQMASNIAAALSISPEDVSLKAGTNEKLGFIGRGEGIAAEAVAIIERPC